MDGTRAIIAASFESAAGWLSRSSSTARARDIAEICDDMACSRAMGGLPCCDNGGIDICGVSCW